jgi:hypothetical protein
MRRQWEEVEEGVEVEVKAARDKADHGVQERVVAEGAAVALVDKRKRLGDMQQVLHVYKRHRAVRS